MVLYFLMKISKWSSERNRKIEKLPSVQKPDEPLSEEERGALYSFITNKNQVAISKELKLMNMSFDSISFYAFKKNVPEKSLDVIGLIIEANNGKDTINLTPLSVLASTKKGAFYVKNDEKKLVGFFTPFHIIVLDILHWKMTRSVEDDTFKETETLLLTSFTADHVAAGHLQIKVHTPYLEPVAFIEKYYSDDFKTFISQR